MNIAEGLGNKISGQGNFVSGEGNLVVSGNQMNFDQFKNNFNMPSVQDEIAKRFQSSGLNPFANIMGQPSFQFSNNGIPPSKVQPQTPAVPQNLYKNGQNSNNLYPSMSSNTGSQTSKTPQGISDNKQVPLRRPVDYFPNINFGAFGPSSQKAPSYPQETSNLIKTFPNTGFQTLQRLHNLQTMGERPSMVVMNLPNQLNGNRPNNDGYYQQWNANP